MARSESPSPKEIEDYVETMFRAESDGSKHTFQTRAQHRADARKMTRDEILRETIRVAALCK